VAPEDALFSIAEIGIGLAGFSGLVAAFVQHPGQTWRADQKARIVFLILLSFGLIVAAHRIVLLGEPPEPAPLVVPFLGVAGILSKDIRLLGLLMVLMNVATFIEVIRPTANPWS